MPIRQDVFPDRENSVDARTIRKLQVRLLPLLFLLFVVAWIDRINLGFAALTMNQELGISSEHFGFAAGIFFIGYFLFEVPSNLLLHKIGARIWITRILISWGILATMTGSIRTIHQLYFMRFLLGLAEAGYFPGIVLYLTGWFPRRERAQALVLFMLGGPVSKIVGAPISGFILDHIHWLGLSSWRWLLMLEGAPAIACGLLTYFLLPSRPEEAKFLSSAEKGCLQRVLHHEQKQKLAHHNYPVFQTFVNGRVWSLAAIDLGVVIGKYALDFWAPQLLKSVSGAHSNSVIGLLDMIPHLAGLIAMVLVSRSSDRRLERRWHAAVPAMLGGLSLLLIGSFHSPVILVALLSLLAMGVYSWAGPFWALPSEFLTGPSAAAGIAIINSVASLGGFVGPWVIGVMGVWAGGVYGALAITGLPLLISASSLLFVPNRSNVHNSKGERPRRIATRSEIISADTLFRYAATRQRVANDESGTPT
jgi:MFS transporter, ACS family, tartrate transporter